MACGCAERGKILGQAARAAKAGNLKAAGQRVGLVARSAAHDMALAAKRAVAAARLAQRRR